MAVINQSNVRSLYSKYLSVYVTVCVCDRVYVCRIFHRYQVQLPSASSAAFQVDLMALGCRNRNRAA